MDKETFEIITDIADAKGGYEQKTYDLEYIIYALIESAGVNYSGDCLNIDAIVFTSILRAFDNDAVCERIKKLIEARKEGEDE